MQTKLTEEQIGNCREIAKLLLDETKTFNWFVDCDYWLGVYERLCEISKHGTSDGKPYVKPEPTIPEGYRKAKPDEWQRTDVKIWLPEREAWVPRLFQGDEFDPTIKLSRYIVPCRPPVPEGWRVASEDEYHRSDIKTWEGSHDGDRGHWRVRPGHKAGKPFNGPNYLYIVPIEPPLTDQDACVWPRLLVMVRDNECQEWKGPFIYKGKDDDTVYPFVAASDRGRSRAWTYARRATPEEIEAAK